MVIRYPETLRKPGPLKDLPKKLILPLGEGLNIVPFEAQGKIEFTVTPVAKGFASFFGFFSQLKKWGFEAFKIEESVQVSPVYEEYYRVTMAQKDQLSAQIKQALASISTAISDLEMIKHDLRKYKEFMDYFGMIEKGRKLIKEGKKEEGERLFKRGDQSLRAVFIDQVDVHTGETIALKLIASRWPTIISDFMKLKDDDVEQGIIKERYKVSEAEAVVLATKNRLYLEWRDELFKQAVRDRYENLISMREARKKSIEEYKNMVRPIIARYRSIRELLEKSPGELGRVTVWKVATHAVSIDKARYWAWKPFAPTEKYKLSAEAISQVDVRTPWGRNKIGFHKWEIDYIMKELRNKERSSGLGYYEELLLHHGLVETLPMEPSIDNVVRRFIPDIEREYHVKITPLDLFKVRNMLLDKFKASAVGTKRMWDFSPYFVFLDMNFGRVVVKVPTGYAEESVEIDPFIAATETQNIILLRYLEILARDRELDNYIAQMLGEMGVSGESIEELIRKSVFGVEEEKVKMGDITKPKYTILQRIRKPFYDLLRYFDIEIAAFNIGPYEFNLNHRITKFYQVYTSEVLRKCWEYAKAKFDVPGAKLPLG